MQGRPVLAADGWIEYPYSQTVFAAWQAGEAYDAPTLESAGTDGVWHTVIDHFGYPAGMPRGMALPLDAVPPGTTRLRLRTNMQIYWDRLHVIYAEPLPDARVQVLAPTRTALERSGFPRRTTGPQQLPHYDYAQRAPFADMRYMAGDYTAFGDVTPLVAEEDDALLIIGPGEEAHMEFPLPVNPAPVSATSTSRRPSPPDARIETSPPSGGGAMPCLIAFSTRVSRIIGGSEWERTCSAISTENCRRSPRRMRRMLR